MTPFRTFHWATVRLSVQNVKDVACLGGYGNGSVVEREKEISRKYVRSSYTQVRKSLNAGSLLSGRTSGLYTPEGHATPSVILVLSGIVLWSGQGFRIRGDLTNPEGD